MKILKKYEKDHESISETFKKYKMSENKIM
jgi:hypothetical protein